MVSYTDPRDAILQYNGWLLGHEGDWRAAKVAAGKRHGKSVIVRFEGYDDREQAAALIGVEIGVIREALPNPEDGHYYWMDLVGLRVVRRDGTVLGRIEYMLETGANDVMVVQGECERLIPFIKDEVVLSVDLKEGLVNVDWEWD